MTKNTHIISRETKIGRLGESIAVKYLKERGFFIIDRNANFHGVGEVDVVCIKNDVIHFVEVKTSESFDLSNTLHPLSHFNLDKKEKLKAAMGLFIKQRKIGHDQPRCLDLIGVSISRETSQAEVIFEENIYFEYY